MGLRLFRYLYFLALDLQNLLYGFFFFMQKVIFIKSWLIAVSSSEKFIEQLIIDRWKMIVADDIDLLDRLVQHAYAAMTPSSGNILVQA